VITEAVLQEVLLDIQSREQHVTFGEEKSRVEVRCENYMIDLDVVAQVAARVISVNMAYMGGGAAAINPEGVAAEAFIAGVICGRMETLGGM
jgi:hypothetical protein